MRNGINQNAIACLMVCLLALSGVGLAQAEPECSESQYGGTIIYGNGNFSTMGYLRI